MRRLCAGWLLALGVCVWSSAVLGADEGLAVALSRRIQASHMPSGLLFDSIYVAPGSRERIGYLGYGDAALWTGLYVAAEAHRFAVTRDSEARAAVVRSLEAIDRLSRLSGDGLLARYYYPVDDPHVPFFLQDRAGTEYHRTRLDGAEYYYVTRTSRDQYSGVFFGLGSAYDLVDHPDVQRLCRSIATRLVQYLIAHDWHIYRHDGSLHDTFFHRPEQRLSILRVAAHLDPGRFEAEYRRHRRTHSRFAFLGVLIDVIQPRSAYYKFNLDHLYFYNLLRLEPRGSVPFAQYERAYRRMREAVRHHQNAHFNMIDRALRGPDAARDRETASLLAGLAERGLRDRTRDGRGDFKACGANRACSPLPVAARVSTDFLWQREPFTLYAEGDERIERSGLDYILPYWMARYYGVVTQ